MHSALELEKNMQFAYIRIFLLGEYLYLKLIEQLEQSNFALFFHV